MDETTISCFLLYGKEEDARKTVAALQDSDWEPDEIFLLYPFGVKHPEIEGCQWIMGDNLVSTDILKFIGKHSKGTYTLLYNKTTPLSLGYLSIRRMVRIAFTTHAGIVYSDRYQQVGDELRPAPTLDYQKGSLREDFDFGSLMLLKTQNIRREMSCVYKDYEYAGWYDLRLRLSEEHSIVRINEFLYTEMETDTRTSGEKQFDYVDPKNREAQIEMEEAFTDYLRDIDALLFPVHLAKEIFEEDFEYEASVIIPVKNRVATIRDAVNSALSQQTNFKYNVIVVDNHSTDGTTEALKEYADDKRLIHVIPSREDLGIGGCWNLAVSDKRCGRFSVQLDSDDLYKDEHSLQIMVDAFHENKCSVVIGTYQMVDFDLNEIPPGIIDHREWTPDNGHNNALRLNGMGAPRAFYTPLIRDVPFPNISYGEDYATCLSLSTTSKIGRVYEVVYLCRRWSGNSDAALSLEQTNRNNYSKDRIRSLELSARVNIMGDVGILGAQLIFDRMLRLVPRTPYTKENEKARELNWKRKKSLCVTSEKFQIHTYIFLNAARIRSVTAPTEDSEAISNRPCFLCKENRLKGQLAQDFKDYDLLFNPYPVFAEHITMAHKEHIPQAILGRFEEMVDFAQILSNFYLMYNGPACGASAPDHLHFQAASKEAPMAGRYDWDNWSGEIVIRKDNLVIDTALIPLTAVRIRTKTKGKMIHTFYQVYHQLHREPREEPMMNILLWYNPTEIAGDRGMEEYIYDKTHFVYNCVIFLRGKHRPDCYYAEGDEQILVSPAIAELNGIFPMVREEDIPKLTKEKITEIYREISITADQMENVMVGLERVLV
ncbi:MAG: DUF4922 domain-containing protein [Mediterranea sp.]|jgi:glycosyltransferase involved in cell wall biosynthesis|nr:DUF4922 domain-containing protein [Mediterranea sp.]